MKLLLLRLKLPSNCSSFSKLLKKPCIAGFFNALDIWNNLTFIWWLQPDGFSSPVHSALTLIVFAYGLTVDYTYQFVHRLDKHDLMNRNSFYTFLTQTNFFAFSRWLGSLLVHLNNLFTAFFHLLHILRNFLFHICLSSLCRVAFFFLVTYATNNFFIVLFIYSAEFNCTWWIGAGAGGKHYPAASDINC